MKKTNEEKFLELLEETKATKQYLEIKGHHFAGYQSILYPQPFGDKTILRIAKYLKRDDKHFKLIKNTMRNDKYEILVRQQYWKP